MKKIILALGLLNTGLFAANKPIQVKVVVIAMFERGEDTGDTPGEYQLWVEREHLDEVLPMPAAYHHVRMNKDGVLGMLTGVGTAKAAASVMALGSIRASISPKPTGWSRGSAVATPRMFRSAQPCGRTI